MFSERLLKLLSTMRVDRSKLSAINRLKEAPTTLKDKLKGSLFGSRLGIHIARPSSRESRK